jgi:adenosylcobinamide kinase/adenosylcobinamide-phosphate guanylyltransferase
MAKRLTLILGGARSGKSTHAEMLANAHISASTRAPSGRVLYVATAEALDDDMAARIAAHRAQRPAHWRTLEAPRAAAAHLARALAVDRPEVVLIDCITLLASNVLLSLPEAAWNDEAMPAVLAEVDSLLQLFEAQAAASAQQWIVVSNEVGLGVVPEYASGRIYRDALGRANQRLAAAADVVLLMVAGLPLVVKGAGKA